MDEGVARYYQPDPKSCIIHVYTDDIGKIIASGNTWDDIQEGITWWFVNDQGFSSESVIVRPFGDAESMQAEVEFVDDGAVMAKLLGYIE